MSVEKVAIVTGAGTGIGAATARQLVDQGWSVVAADLSDPAALSRALDGLAPGLVAITAWTRKDTEAENIAVNGGAVRNLLTALEPAKSMRHVALMTGLKHYLGP